MYAIGINAKYYCNEPFANIELSSGFCELGGKWEPAPPQCKLGIKIALRNNAFFPNILAGFSLANLYHLTKNTTFFIYLASS